MSMSYWGIVGYGVCLDDIDTYLDKDKINKLVRKMNPEIEFEEDVFDDYTFYGDPYNNLAEFLCEFDGKHILTWEDDGQGKAFFMYEPIYPWLKYPKPLPRSVDEVKKLIISILMNVCNATEEELGREIGYISTWGCS